MPSSNTSPSPSETTLPAAGPIPSPSGWRSRLASALPRRGSGEILPALACATLLGALGLQFALPIRTELPEPVAVPVRHIGAAPAPAVGDYPRVVTASIFSPSRSGGGAAAGLGASSPAAGISAYAAVGVAIGPTVASAVVKGPDGTSHTVRLGGAVAGWRLSGLERGRLIFTRAGERHAMTVGARPAATATTTAAPAATVGGDGEDPQ